MRGHLTGIRRRHPETPHIGAWHSTQADGDACATTRRRNGITTETYAPCCTPVVYVSQIRTKNEKKTGRENQKRLAVFRLPPSQIKSRPFCTTRTPWKGENDGVEVFNAPRFNRSGVAASGGVVEVKAVVRAEERVVPSVPHCVQGPLRRRVVEMSCSPQPPGAAEPLLAVSSIQYSPSWVASPGFHNLGDVAGGERSAPGPPQLAESRQSSGSSVRLSKRDG
ncbi:hypothetical protein B0H16DRAFT_1471282 [Mycena metata]|uniref:Uncharacterized protein n=1 Tax=Mycena metata TaxID=1033252 RepID=A0AAD7MP83_9AGAR|nr:hypothetical protein B0H16DRAFT_1471282 [Mycena metata]